MKYLYELGLPISKPIDIIGMDDVIKSLFSWIDGMDAADKINSLSKKEQYHLGKESGEILTKIHELNPQKNLESWEVSYKSKIERNMSRYESCDLAYPNGASF